LRPKFEAQREFEFPTSNLKLTREYYAKYEAISKILDANPEIADLAHRDLRRALIASNRSRPSRVRFTTEHVLRLLIAQSLEGLSLRRTVIRVDDSPALRQFVRLGPEPMSVWDLLAPEVVIPAVLLLGFLLASALVARRLLVRSQ
jgi:hypothetical protein